jgi:hypothetical protein
MFFIFCLFFFLVKLFSHNDTGKQAMKEMGRAGEKKKDRVKLTKFQLLMNP